MEMFCDMDQKYHFDANRVGPGWVIFVYAEET